MQHSILRLGAFAIPSAARRPGSWEEIQWVVLCICCTGFREVYGNPPATERYSDTNSQQPCNSLSLLARNAGDRQTDAEMQRCRDAENVSAGQKPWFHSKLHELRHCVCLSGYLVCNQDEGSPSLNNFRATV